MIVGPDGFLCMRDDPRAACHAFLNDVLRAQAADPAHEHRIAEAAVKAQSKAMSKEQLVALAMAAFDRTEWIEAHARELADAGKWVDRVGNVLYHLYALRLPFSGADMGRVIMGRRNTAPPVARISEYFASRELTPDLAAVVRARRERYRAHFGPGGHSHVQFQSELQLLDMLLWHDETEPLDPAACWSERVRHDFRAMTGERQVRWRWLLRHVRGDAGSNPPKPWVKEAQRHLAAVGAEDFRAMITAWFACFGEPEPLRLSVVGSHVLKGLLWYCALARDPAATAAALPLLDATWKPKRNLDKVMVALGVLIDTMSVDEAWTALVRLQNAWGASQGRIERLLIKVGSALGLAEEQLRAQGMLKPPPSTRPLKWPDPLAAKMAVAGIDMPTVEEVLAVLNTPDPLGGKLPFGEQLLALLQARRRSRPA